MDSYIYHRRHDRFPHEGEVILKPQFGDNAGARVKDVSEGGAFIVSERRFTVQTRVTLYLPVQIERKNTLLIIAAKVVRAADPVKEKPGYGVEFDSNLSQTTKKILAAFLAQKTIN